MDYHYYQFWYKIIDPQTGFDDSFEPFGITVLVSSIVLRPNLVCVRYFIGHVLENTWWNVIKFGPNIHQELFMWLSELSIVNLPVTLWVIWKEICAFQCYFWTQKIFKI